MLITSRAMGQSQTVRTLLKTLSVISSSRAFTRLLAKHGC